MKYTLTIDDSGINRAIILRIPTNLIPRKYSEDIFDCFVAQRFLQESGISMCLPDVFFVNRCCPIPGYLELSFMITSKEFGAFADYEMVPEYRLEAVKTFDDVVYRKVAVEL